MIRVKICCISTKEEAKLAIKYGASALGLVSQMPSGPGVIPEELISEIAEVIPPGISSFLLTSKQDAGSIIQQQRRTGVNTIQLCDRLETGSYDQLRKAMPGISLVQVIHVNGRESVDEAVSVSPYVNAILLDSGNQTLPIKELGGTGRVHDWNLSAEIRSAVNIPVFLAGGLTHENVLEAVRKVHPFGVDICSGVRTNDKLDISKLGRFFEQANKY
ncbi:MAG: phosphoribosylanthranilate isomerase [Ignavibacteriaceae bacterium]|nr:phosphoribosylanthranilate isomerase [Ignavibacteriaceae bacterium]